MNREERAINPGAQHLFNYHKQIGYARGRVDGIFYGIFLGVFGILVLELMLSLATM